MKSPRSVFVLNFRFWKG